MQDGNVHCHIGNLSRKKANGRERSAVTAAAYISGTALWNEREQKVSNFGGRKGVLHREIIAAPNAPDWVHNRETLWNTIESHLKRKDARLAKTIEVAITRDIPQDQWTNLLHAFVQPYIDQGMVADVAIHEDGTNHNPHIHVLLTVNELKPNGFGKKITNVDHKSFVTRARTGWETITNKFLKASGSSIRVDARSYKSRGIAQQPTQHRGPNQQERRLRRAIAQEHREKDTTMVKGTQEERVLYPLLTQREEWPPVNEAPEPTMSHEERSELARYWRDTRIQAQHAGEQEFEDNRVGEWFEIKEREAREARVNRDENDRPWYEQAQDRARGDGYVRDDPSIEGRRFADDLAERRIAYERDVWRRAVNTTRTREEHELIMAAKSASPELRKRIENEILEQRMHRIRVQDDADRLAALEHELKPSLREKLEKFVSRERDVDRYPDQEPGPYNRPHSPSELDQARERLIEENERER